MLLLLLYYCCTTELYCTPVVPLADPLLGAFSRSLERFEQTAQFLLSFCIEKFPTKLFPQDSSRGIVFVNRGFFFAWFTDWFDGIILGNIQKLRIGTVLYIAEAV